MTRHRGPYRRLFCAFPTSKRFNQLPEDAELLFWRLVVTADDYGNLRGEPALVRCVCLPLRDWPVERITAALDALVVSGLISRYTDGTDDYLHVEQFEERQATKNGKRYQLHPRPNTIQIDPDSSGCIQVHPDSSRFYNQPKNEGETNAQVHPGESRCIQVDPDAIKNKSKSINPPTPQAGGAGAEPLTAEEPETAQDAPGRAADPEPGCESEPPPEPRRREKTAVQMYESHMGRGASPYEMRAVVEWPHLLADDPVYVGEVAQDPYAVLEAAIGEIPRTVAKPIPYLRSIIETARATGTIPGRPKTTPKTFTSPESLYRALVEKRITTRDGQPIPAGPWKYNSTGVYLASGDTPALWCAPDDISRSKWL